MSRPSNKMANSFQFNIAQWDGDQETFKLFRHQVTQMSELNKWSPSLTAAFIKSKLCGNALKYVSASPDLLVLDDPNALLSALSDFFLNDDDCANFSTESLNLLPNESIKNFGFRLSQHISKLYPQISDKSTLDSIKYVQFMSSIPSSIKTQLLKEDVKEFSAALKRAQTLQNIDSQATSSSFSHSSEGSADVFLLKQQVSALEQKLLGAEHNVSSHSQCYKKDDSQTSYKSVNSIEKCNVMNSCDEVLKHKNENKFKSKNRLSCQYCNKPGHTARNCFKLKRDMCNNKPNHKFSQKRNVNNSYRPNSSKSHNRYSKLNPNAEPYNSNLNFN